MANDLSNMDVKEKYRALCQSEQTIPLSSQDWWLDIVAGENNWQVAAVEKNGEIVASLPYLPAKQMGFPVIRMPGFTPSLGVWIKYPDGQKYNSKLAYEHSVCDELISQLPDVQRFYQRFHPDFTNWLPFFWRGFRQTTRYVYIINDLSDLDAVFANFRENIRREIRKAKKKLTVFESDDIETLYDLIGKTFSRQDKSLGFSLDFFKKLDAACKLRNCRKILFAKDDEGNLHSGLYLVWDGKMAYYLQGGSDPEFRNSGAASLVMWEGIQFAATVTQQYNFAGSMIAPIERFFRSFGGVQTPYFSIYKSKFLFKLIDAYRDIK